MKRFTYNIDIVGGCNLKCPSCPVGNSPKAPRPKGRMPIELYERILEKIRSESPAPPYVELFNWAEPFLHPRLPEFIESTRARGMPAYISGNLNTVKNLDDVIRAGPGVLRITVSGFSQEVYGRTHVGGDIESVKANMHKVREALDRHKSETRVDLIYLCYVDNVGVEYDSMAALSRRLRFSFSPCWALLMPVEKYLEHYEEGLPERDQTLIDLLAVHPDESKAISLRHVTSDCRLRFRQTAINCDGSVALCCGTYDGKHTIAESFLDVSHRDLQKAKYSHPLCTQCMEHGVHVTAIYGGIEEWNKVAAAKLRLRVVPKELIPQKSGLVRRGYRKMLRLLRSARRRV